MQSVIRFANLIFRPPSVKGRDWKVRSHMYLFRLGTLMSLVLVPAFAVFYHAAKPLESVSWLCHAMMGSLSLGLLLLSYVAEWPQKHAQKLLIFQGFLVTTWAGALSYINGFDANYAIGFFLTTISCAMFLSLAFDQIRALTLYTGFAILSTLVLIGISPTSEVNEAIYIASMLVSLAMVYVAVSARIQVQEALEERESHLMEAQKTAALGNWELNLKTNRLYWSHEMFRVAGLNAREDKASFDEFADRLHPEDQARFASFWRALKSGEKQDDLTLRLRVANGTVRTLRLRGARGRAGQAGRRLFGICQDVTVDAERERVLTHAKNVAEHALEEAERAREQAEEMARMKSEFLANMSHEIRTPLTAIIGFAQVLGEEVGDDKKGLVEPIEHSGKRLLTTLNSVLDLAQMRADGMNMEIMPVDVAEEAHEFAEMLRSLATEKGLTLTVNGPVCGLYANADKAALSRVLTNLVSNAIKFTDKGRVTLSVDREDVYACIRVRDTGRGIGAEFLPKLFEEFRQESTGTTRSHEGSGLGLAITKGLVEQMGGTISVDSTVGLGSVFTVLLPLSPEQEIAQVEESSIRQVEV